jgi:hypothetical protein
MNIVREMLAWLQLAHDMGWIKREVYLKLRREIWRFALTKTQDEERLRCLLRKLNNIVEPHL